MDDKVITTITSLLLAAIFVGLLSHVADTELTMPSSSQRSYGVKLRHINGRYGHPFLVNMGCHFQCCSGDVRSMLMQCVNPSTMTVWQKVLLSPHQNFFFFFLSNQ